MTAATTPPPLQYIYKIAPSTPSIPIDPNTTTLPATYTLPASALDTASKFIHLSTAAQIPGTLHHFFASPPTQRSTVYLLRLPHAPLADAGVLRWESPDAKICGPREGEGMFPHVYFPGGRLTLGCDDVEGVKEVVSGVGVEGWEDALRGLQGWLV